MTMLSAIRKAVEADPIGGSALIDEVIYSYLSDQAESLRPEIEQVLSAFMAERVAIAKRSLGRTYVESMINGDYPSEDVQKSAQWIADLEFFITDSISKSELTGNDLYEFNRKHPRGQGGRFRQGLPHKLNPKHDTTSRKFKNISPVLQHTAITELPDQGAMHAPGRTPSEIETANMEQHQYEQANRLVTAMLAKFSGSELQGVSVAVNLTSPDNSKRTRYFPAAKLKNNGFGGFNGEELWNAGDVIDDIELEAKPNASEETKNRIAAYNTLGNVGGSALAQIGAISPQSQKALFDSLNRNKSQRNSRLSNFFNRMTAGSEVMNQVPGMEKYGQYARFVGTMGPQAEEALGPYVQQAAYRYRGTEKEPDLELIRQFNGRTMRAVDAAAETRTKTSDISDQLMADSLDRANQGDITLQAASYEINNLSRRRGGAFTPDELKLNVRADVAAHHLLSTLPDDPFVARVSEESGHILPSQGVIIDADGDVVSQSVGFSDDHYLPFDLKNLKALRGGQYVRTRQQGGLTGEDIYASIRTGARMATVVSSSGVYSIEFDPNFRGARANSDKARAMYDRYLKILDSMEKSKLYIKDIDGTEKAKLRAQAQAMGDTDGTIYRRFLDERREAGKNLDEGTLAILQEEAQQQADSEGFKTKGDRYNRRVEEIFDELTEEKMKERVSQLSLNAKGYEVALKTLQQQFPYFIRNVSYQPLTSKQQGEGFLQNLNQSGKLGARQSLSAKDRGYVNPGGLRPEHTRRGFKNPSTGDYNKFKNEDFYNSSVDDTVAKPKEETKSESGTTAGGPKNAPKSKSAFLNQVDLFASGQKEKGIKAAKALDIMISQIPDGPIGLAPNDPSLGVGAINWDDVKNDPDAREVALKILLHKQGGGIASRYATDPDIVAGLLTDKKLVENVAGMYNNDEQATRGFGGSNASYDDVLAKILAAGNELANAASFEQPFAEQVSGSRGEFYAGVKPQNFKEISDLTDLNSIKAFLSDDKNRAVADAYNELKDNPSDGAVLSQIIPSLKALEEAHKKERAAFAAVQQPGAKPEDYTPKVILAQAGITPDEWSSILGNPSNLTAYGYSEHAPMSQFSESVVQGRARALQLARSLLVAERLMGVMAGGEEAPKAQAPGEPSLEPTSKNLSKAYWSQQDPNYLRLSKARLSPRVQVLSKSHPLTREIQMRKSLNLPLVSKKPK